MPVEAGFRKIHSAIPGAVEGYELAPGTGKGFWSIVSPTGTVTNLNDLGLQVLAYAGGGMPPVENVSTQLGVLGGSYLQRTVIRPRTIILTCIAQGFNLGQIQRIKSQIIAQVAPYNSLNTSKAIKLRYQLTNYCGDATGTTLEVAVTYAGDLTGQTTNLYQDRFDLQFVEFNPPSIKELTVSQPSLSYNTTRTSTTGVRYRTASGDWKFISFANPYVVHYDLTGELWYGNNTTVTNRSASVSQAINNYASAIAHDQNNVVYVGGSFTSPQNYIMKYSSGSWSAVGATINGPVYHMAFDNSGNLYAAGSFSTPAGSIGKYNGSTWSSLGTGTNGLVFDIIKGLDGYIYIAGGFTTANGVACNNIAKYTGSTFVPLGAGTNGTIYALALLPDGRIVAAGAFSTAGGISCSGVAVWNGTQWQPLNGGLAGTVVDIVANPLNGDIYANGLFLASSAGVSIPRFGKYTGSVWVPQDASSPVPTDFLFSALDIRASDGELALLSDISAGTFSNGVLNTISYTGTADVTPQIKFTGPGILWAITNYRTGKSIYFNNYTMLAGETATFSFDPLNGISFVSSFYGNVVNRLLPGSDISAFSLLPGDNYIVPYITSATGATKCELIYQNTHFSFEAGAV